MSVTQPPARTGRFTAIALAATVAWVLAVAVLIATVPAAQSSTQSAKTYASSAPEVVFRTMVDSATRTLARVRHAGTMVVFGDSVTARYNHRAGDPDQGFWSMLAHQLGARPEVRAEGGSGFVNPGLVGCVGSTFGDQLARPAVAETVAGAGAVIIEGGRTDTQTCRAGGGYDLVPGRQVRRAVDAFMGEVQRLRGGDPACTVVIVPWGPAGLAENRDRISRVVRQAAVRHGFTFVDTIGLLTEATTIEDRVHPTRQGNEDLVRAILDQTAVEGCFG
jgi:hypothetical protein